MSYLSTPTARKRFVAEELLENEIQWVEFYDLLPEGQRVDLDASTTGVKYTGVSRILVDAQLVRHVKSAYLEFSIPSISTNAKVKVHVYDYGATANIVSSADVTAATQRTRVSIPVATLEAAIGHELTVKAEVTANVSGGKFTLSMARLVLVKGVS